MQTVLKWELLKARDKGTRKEARQQSERGHWFWGSAIPEEVSIKGQALQGNIDVVIDALPGSRYSQAQIKDLVAYANPRYLRAVESSGSRPPCAPGNLLQRLATSLSCNPPSSSLTAGNFYNNLPGGSDNGSARFISHLNRPTGGYRPL